MACRPPERTSRGTTSGNDPGPGSKEKQNEELTSIYLVVLGEPFRLVDRQHRPARPQKQKGVEAGEPAHRSPEQAVSGFVVVHHGGELLRERRELRIPRRTGPSAVRLFDPDGSTGAGSMDRSGTRP